MFSKNIYVASRVKLGLFFLELYDDYIAGVDKNITFNDRIKSVGSDYRRFDNYFKTLRRKVNGVVEVDVKAIKPTIELAIMTANQLNGMSKVEREVFTVIIDAYNYPIKKNKWTL